MNSAPTTRRDFLKKSIAGSIGLAAGWRSATLGGTAYADTGGYTASVAITKGSDRADNAFRALQMFKKEIATAIGHKRVVIKPNFVWYSNPYACTRVEHVEGILEFLKSIGKRDVDVAESSAQGPIMNGYNTYVYWGLTKKYPVKLMDLNQEGSANVQIWQYGDINNSTQRTIRISKLYLNPNNFIISATPMKTHNTVVVTLATKNIGMSAPVIDIGNSQGQTGARGDKSWMHGASGSPPGDYQCLNDNVYRMVSVHGIRPHLAVIDGYQGMQGDGPVNGSGIPTPQQLALVSQDWLAADRIALTLMGTNVNATLNHRQDDGYAMPYPAVLNYCWMAGLGEWDDRKIHVIGDVGDMAGNSLVGNANVVNYSPSPTQSSQLGMRAYPREGTWVNHVQEEPPA